MARNKAYLSDAQKRAIIKSTTESLATTTIDNIKSFNNLTKLNNELKKIGKVIEQQAKIYYTDLNREADALRLRYTMESNNDKGKEREESKIFSNTRKNIKTNKDKLMTSLAKGYLMIMTLREILLGEKINYHIYVGNDFGDTRAVTLGDKAILDLMMFPGSSFKQIEIGNKKIEELEKNVSKDYDNIDEILKDMEERSIAYQDFLPKIIDRDFEIFVNKGQKLYKIQHQVIDNDTSISDAYKMQLFKKGTNDIYDKKNRSRNAFNRGHLAEAFDIAYDSLITVGKQIYQYDSLRTPYFYKNLVYDNIKATRGGDNAVRLEQQFSVKAYAANLYNISTLYGDIVELTTMIDLVLTPNENNKQKIKEHLYNMFIDNSKFKDAFGDAADNEINKILDESINILFNSVKK